MNKITHTTRINSSYFNASFEHYRSAGTFCNDPGQVPHATRSNNNQGPFEHETVITYECDIGYHGGGYVTCQRNGEWTSIPTCTPHGMILSEHLVFALVVSHVLQKTIQFLRSEGISAQLVEY